MATMWATAFQLTPKSLVIVVLSVRWASQATMLWLEVPYQ
jgi:hypothetical protein